MSDPISMTNWIINSVAILLIVEGVIEIVNAVYKKDQTTIHQARIWLRSLLMIVSAIVIFWINRKTPISIGNMPKVRMTGNNNGAEMFR